MFRLANLFDLSGRRALVTGVNSGIGLALARALGLAGAAVVLVARREADLASAADELQREDIAATTVAADLADPAGIARIGQAMNERQVDILVNAAGVNLRQPFGSVTPEAFDLHLAVHLRAPFLLVQRFAPAMAERRWGRVINLASMQSTRAFANSAPYGAAKGGIVQLTRAIAEAWSAKGVTCNAIAPGFFPTNLTKAVFDDPAKSAQNAAQTSIGRNGELPDLYGAIVFLASYASAYVTGQTLNVDGGFSAK